MRRLRRSLLVGCTAMSLALGVATIGSTPAAASSGGGCHGFVTFTGSYSTVYVKSCINSPSWLHANADAYLSYSHNYNHRFTFCALYITIYNTSGRTVAGPTSINCINDANAQRQYVHYLGPTNVGGGLFDHWYTQTCVTWLMDSSSNGGYGCVNSPVLNL